MSIEISAKSITPVRLTYGNLEERFGGKKPASRYQEAVYDVQPTANFQYRPLWDKNHELYDVSRTVIVMEDWYSFADPRQYYYGSYTIARSKQQEVAEHNFNFVDQRDLFDSVPDSVKQSVRDILVPLRHVEWAANMNNCQITDECYGANFSSIAMFNAMDRLGMAQYVTRIGLLLDGNEDTSLVDAKKVWMEAAEWQGLRHAIEDMFVLDDWFELMVAQNFVLDGLIFPLLYDRFEKKLTKEGGATIAMLTEFMDDWYKETVRWTNALAKVTAKESAANQALLSGWVSKWVDRLSVALEPIAIKAFGEDGINELAEVKSELLERLAKQGVTV
ncbi:MAG: phenol hydroxylase P1 protein [Cycloclasticus sp.]|jgi:phenol hydroxylase P1 protein